jgi:hypothetical protein
MKKHDPEIDLFRQMNETHPGPDHKPSGPENRFDSVFPFLCFCAAISTYFGVTSVLPGEGPSHALLKIFLSGLAGGLAYIGHKAAFHLGAKQAAAGDVVSGGICVGWFLTLTAVVGTIGFAGVSRDIVEDAIARKPAAQIVTASRMIGSSTENAKDVVPRLRNMAQEYAGFARCELKGCVSGRPGRGPEVATLQALSEKFTHVVRLFERADAPQKALAKRLEKLASKYEAALNKGGATGPNRAVLVGILAEVQTVAIEADRALPRSAVRGLTRDLRGLASSFPTAGRIDVAGRMRQHADALEVAVPATREIVLDPMPEPSGITVGWRRLDLTWALMVFIYGLELVALILWSLLVRDFVRGRRAAAKANERDGSNDDNGDFDPNVIVGRRNARWS